MERHIIAHGGLHCLDVLLPPGPVCILYITEQEVLDELALHRLKVWNIPVARCLSLLLPPGLHLAGDPQYRTVHK